MKYYEVEFNIAGNDDTLQDARDIVVALAGETGFESFEDSENGIKGYIQMELFDRQTLDNVLADFPFDDTKVTYEVKEAEYRDWNEEWEQEGFSPIIVNDRCVIHDGRHLPDNISPEAICVEIDARLAFGTGTHETTRMIVSELLNTPLNEKSLLDCGCGTGILGIVALKLGATNVMGYDIDEWSTDNTRHNAVINHVSENYEVLQGDASVLEKTDKCFDIIVANINRNILLNDMPAFTKKMKSGSRLILSGFYHSDNNLLKERALSLRLSFKKMVTDNDWAMMVFSKD